ncbi:hypothetical protein LIER_17205 [Lithospermum erythrorhizon]|uniref:Retrovirus-related Pol polyprotein from transposon TNT 1-94-like beta-barrel domain-containing protein n=1 Tax=Lithospermum erythrorhizon TaxID=34254 RepID=A0AAV3QDU3_LITER
MKNLLRAKGLWSIIELGISLPVDETILNINQRELLEDARTKDHQVKHYLFQALDRFIFEQILDRSTSKIVWDSLKRKCGGNEKVKKFLRNGLRRKFELLEMKKGESVNDYFGRVTSISNKLRSNGEPMNDFKIVEKILRILEDKFTYTVVSIEESQNIITMTADDLQSTLTNLEQKLHTWKNKEVHYDVVEEEVDEDGLLLMAVVEDGRTEQKHIWYIDSGCSNYMCKEEILFLNLDKTFFYFVKLENNVKLLVQGKGDVKMSLNGITYTITNVYFVPKLKSNLLSVGQFLDKGLSVVFKESMCTVFHSKRREIFKS